MIHPLPPLTSWRHWRRDLCHARCLLKVTMFVLPSFEALFDSPPVRIAMIVRPRHWCSDSPPPANPDPNRRDAVTLQDPNSALPLLRGALNLSLTLSGILAVPPLLSLLPPSSSSLLSTRILPRHCPWELVDPSRAALVTRHCS